MKKNRWLLVILGIALVFVIPLAIKGQDLFQMAPPSQVEPAPQTETPNPPGEPDKIETSAPIESPTSVANQPNQEQEGESLPVDQPRERGDGILLPSLEETITVTAEGKAVVTNPDDIVVVVNKQRALPADYKPQDLVEPKVRFSFEGKHEKKLLRQVAAEALEKMFAAAAQEQIELVAVSGFRSYQTQTALFDRYVQRDGFEAASRYSAWPGHSEHQTGLTMDVSSASANFSLEEFFADTPEGKWLAEHAAQYGFIIRYPQGKEEITGYTYEPWHLRYVGPELAQAVFAEQLTLEEYMQQAVPVSN